MTDLGEIWAGGLQRGVLQIPCCDNCAAWNWYPLPACRACHGTRFSWKLVSLAGVLHSWTRVHRSFASPAIATPYTVGLVDLVDAPVVRIPCRLPDVSTGSPPVIGAAGSLRAAGDSGQQFWQFQPDILKV